MSHQFNSAIYTGRVRHRRFSPKAHVFEYTVFMMYLDTQEIDDVISLSACWSRRKWAPVQFRRTDFHIDANNSTSQKTPTLNRTLPSVDESVRNTVEHHTGVRPSGPIRMLVNLRYWGFNMNPLSTYYCFNQEDTALVAILAEVHNTPWQERHTYVLTSDCFGKKQQVNFNKAFHVSPFNPMDMEYRWHSTQPEHTLAIHLENWCAQEKIMDATMTLVREEITASALNKVLIRFPLMTVKIVMAIYWQALRLWIKGVPFHSHPEQKNTRNTAAATIKTSPIKTTEKFYEDTKQ